MAAPDFPAFRARAPWWGADLQTLRNVLRGPVVRPLSEGDERILLPLGDDSGDALCGALSQSDVPQRGAPLVVLVHGLSGSEESAYMHSSGRFWLDRGHRVLRLNLRGAGPSREHCRFQYHAGRSEDLRAALTALPRDLAQDGFILVGYSLGGNMLLKFLAESGGEFPIELAASVSAPIDLAAASQRFLHPRNFVYHRHLLAALKRECFGGRSEISAAEAGAVRAARTIFEFDEKFVAPRNGFRDAEHYYAENRASRFLDEIRVPTLVVHSLDDPWIPARSYSQRRWDANPFVVSLLSPGGGHVGFHDRGARTPWYDRCIGLFRDSLRRRRSGVEFVPDQLLAQGP